MDTSVKTNIMHDLSNNIYVKRFLSISGAYNLNKLMFGEIAAPRSVSDKEFTFAIHDLLDSVGFTLHLTGYKFLAAIVERYLIDNEYSFDKAAKEISTIYRTTEKCVTDNIFTSIAENKSLATIAQKLLRTEITPFSITSIDGVVEILGAIFKRYFNYNLR